MNLSCFLFFQENNVIADDDDGHVDVVTDNSVDDKDKESLDDPFVAAFKKSALFSETQELLEGEKQKVSSKNRDKKKGIWYQLKKSVKRLKGRYATTFWKQLREVMQRGFLAFWRDPNGIKVRFIVYVCCSFTWCNQSPHSSLLQITLYGHRFGHTLCARGHRPARSYESSVLVVLCVALF